MRTLVAAVVLALALAGCSGDSDSDPADAPSSASPADVYDDALAELARATGQSAAPEGEDGEAVDLVGQASFEVDGLFRVAPRYAVRVGTELDVIVELTAFDVPLEVDGGRAIYTEQAVILTGAEGTAKVKPGGAGLVALRFPDAADATLDGEVTFGVSVGGQPPTSVGFGLQ